MRVLLVEDDDGVAAAVSDVFRAHGHQVERVVRGADALLRHRDADVMLLDLGMPDVDGLKVLSRLRTMTQLPVIVLTARGDEHTVVCALDRGADDFLVKPVRMNEMLARVDALIRRARPSAAARSGLVEVGDIVIDLDAHLVSVGGEPVALTNLEFKILAVLARNVGVVVSRERLRDEVWEDASLTKSRSLDVHLSKIRTKLGRDGLLRTVHGFGFRFGG